MRLLLRVLQILNLIYGAGVIILGFILYDQTGALAPLLIGVGIIIVGPLESLLQRFVRIPGLDPALTAALIDQATSLAFVIAMLSALLTLRPL